ncbi:MAG: hypothetical protein AAB355_03065 [Patescibacteria group bacterium]
MNILKLLLVVFFAVLAAIPGSYAKEGGNRELLLPIGVVTVGPLTKPFNPHEFFRGRDGLWVSPGFTERVLSVARITESADEVSLGQFNLAKDAQYGEISPDSSDDHLLTELWQIAELIKRQPGWGGGPLRYYGENVFYVRGHGYGVFGIFAVEISWCRSNRWCVHARVVNWSDGDEKKGNQIFLRIRT